MKIMTYLYQSHTPPSGGPLRKAPVNPDTGMYVISVLGLNPHFFKYGVSLSLISLYLQKVISISIYCKFLINASFNNHYEHR